jgi:hypothetical protein
MPRPISSKMSGMGNPYLFASSIIFKVWSMGHRI